MRQALSTGRKIKLQFFVSLQRFMHSTSSKFDFDFKKNFVAHVLRTDVKQVQYFGPKCQNFINYVRIRYLNADRFRD